MVHVVAALLIDGDRICITRRRYDAHQGGKWEFPGGKLEAEEPPFAGLQRELREELAIDTLEAHPFMQVRHSYATLDVLLDVWRIARYRGIVEPREGQEMRWLEVAHLDPRDFPDADRPVLRRLQLPFLYLISDVTRFGEEEFAARLERALVAGARLVQLREPKMERRAFCAYARRLADSCHRAGARLLINADPAWLDECKADGVHLTGQRLLALQVRPVANDYHVGASCHDAIEIERAAVLGADFAVLGPVQATASHAGGATLGWERFGTLCESARLPIYAIGGMQASDLARAQRTGAHGLAMISGVWGNEHFETVVRRISSGSSD
jgi:8-oxo-dGTP diphosphatase